MKYGVIVCRQTDNIGDDIQSYAAARLLPQVDYYIEREHMDVFRPKEKEPVNAIINGWLMNNKLGWPISPCINPLYISMHFQENDDLLVGEDFLKGVGAEDLIEKGPVGARDTGTLHMLERNGIPGYFSGCVTLTLPQMPRHENEKPYVCLTDISEEAAAYVRNQYPELDFRTIEHVPNKLPALVEKDAPWPERLKKVEELLEIYQNASAVITTRLHCAMPCLALGTPVLLLQDDVLFDPSRLDGLSELAHTAKTSDFIQGQVRYDLASPPANPTQYLSVRQRLIETVHRFLDDNAACTPELMERFGRYDGEWEKRALWKDELFLNLKKKHEEDWQKTHEAFEIMEAGRKWLEQNNTELKKWIDELEAGKKWIEQQNSTLTQENASLRGWIEELEARKRWMEPQNSLLIRANAALMNSRFKSIPHFIRRLANKLRKQ